MMKKSILLFMLCASVYSFAQVQTPQPSPAATLNQIIGLTDFEVKYSRPSMKERKIFGELVPFDKLWRTGANKNTTIKFSDDIVFGGQEVKAGEYAIFVKPYEEKWTIFLYTDTENWGTPREWNKENIIASVTSKVYPLKNTVESFTIDFNHFTKNSAHLIMMWENSAVSVAIEVPSDMMVMKSIKNAMKDPKPADYYAAAVYFLETDRDINKAKMWIDKAMSSREDKPFWMLRQQSLIYAKAGEKEKAIEFATQSLKGAKKAENLDYINMNKASLKEWGAY